MDNNEFELVKDDLFVNNLNSTLSVKRDFELNEYDYEWLDKIEDVVPYLDNILRNPKRFIINEEEIVKVELARKVTVESVIHLTQHTNLIQDIDKNGDVKPSKILNINKEESLDTYENRFIFTLINNLRTFFEQRIEATGENSFYVDKKDVSYEANTKVGTEDVKISVKISSIDKNIKENNSVVSFSERIRKIKVQLDGFTCSELMQTLSKLHVAPVRSPIRKTNVILKNPNFKKAEELWNYIQSFESKDICEKDKKDYFDKGILKEQYDQTFLMDYIANKAIGSTDGGLSEKKLVNETLQRVIENILDSDVSIDEDKLKEMFNRQISNIKARNIEKANSITNIFTDRFSREKNKMDDIMKLLSSEG